MKIFCVAAFATKAQKESKVACFACSIPRDAYLSSQFHSSPIYSWRFVSLNILISNSASTAAITKRLTDGSFVLEFWNRNYAHWIETLITKKTFGDRISWHSDTFSGEMDSPIGAMPGCSRLGWRHGLIEEVLMHAGIARRLGYVSSLGQRGKG